MEKKNFFARHRFVTVLLCLVFAVGMAIGVAAMVGGAEGVKALGDFVTKQLLGMQWLNGLVGSLFGAIFGADFMATHWGGALQFFVYDVIKIVILLCLLIFGITYIQSYFPPERTKRILGRFHGIGANAIGALLGTVTPFCSCSSIPIFMGFTRAGIASGVTFSFLISSPLVDLGAFVLLASVFGFPIAIAYVVVGLVLAIVGGTIIEKTGLGKHVSDFIMQGEMQALDDEQPCQKERLKWAGEVTANTFKNVFVYILIGVGIGAVIHNFIPAEWIQAVLGQDKFYSVPLATLLGAPMYADIFGTIPVAEALFAKGAGLGTILSFMMSVTALSLPSLIMLSKAVKPKLLFWFVAIVIVGIMIIGFVFNAIAFLFV